MRAMPICELCGEEETSVIKCMICSTRFCEYCGSVEDKKCIECLDYADEDDDDGKEDSDWR